MLERLFQLIWAHKANVFFRRNSRSWLSSSIQCTVSSSIKWFQVSNAFSKGSKWQTVFLAPEILTQEIISLSDLSTSTFYRSSIDVLPFPAIHNLFKISSLTNFHVGANFGVKWPHESQTLAQIHAAWIVMLVSRTLGLTWVPICKDQGVVMYFAFVRGKHN